MPSKYPVLKPDEIMAKLSRAGFISVSQKGSHRKLSNGIRIVIVPMHDEVAKGTLKSILIQAGLTLEEFLSL